MVCFSGVVQRKRDDNKNKICGFQGGVGRGAERKIVQNAIFRGKRHDNKILKVEILLSRNFVVMAQAPSCWGSPRGSAAVCDPNPPRPFARYRKTMRCCVYESEKVEKTPTEGGGEL